MEVPDRVETGQQFSISYVTSNDGGAIPSTQIPFQDRVYLSRDRILDVASDHYVGLVNRREVMAAGESKTISGSYWLPRGLSGNYYVIVATDVPQPSRPLGEVSETDDSNNLRASVTPLLITVPPPTDLQVVDVSIPSTAVVGDTLTTTWTVENRGNVAARDDWPTRFICLPTGFGTLATDSLDGSIQSEVETYNRRILHRIVAVRSSDCTPGQLSHFGSYRHFRRHLRSGEQS